MTTIERRRKRRKMKKVITVLVCATVMVVSIASISSSVILIHAESDLINANKEVKKLSKQVEVLNKRIESVDARVSGLNDHVYKINSEIDTIKKNSAEVSRGGELRRDSISVQLSPTDIEEARYTVQQEAGSGSRAHKEMICFVMMNRLQSSQFPDTLHEVLSNPNQFEGYSNYLDKKKQPDQDTVDAVDAVLVNRTAQDNSKGAIFFCNPKYVTGSTLEWFLSLKEVAIIEGHHFYKNY